MKAGVGRRSTRTGLRPSGPRPVQLAHRKLQPPRRLPALPAHRRRGPADALDKPPVFTDKLPTEKQDVLRQAITDNPGFKAAVANIRASRANIDVQRANYSPTVEVRASTGMDKNLLA